MTAAVTNPFKLTWGTFVLGGTEERLIVGLHRFRLDFEAFEVSCDVLIRGTSDATFATNCAQMQDEFKKRRQAILFQVGTSTILTFNPSSSVNTGFNSYARIDKVGTPGADTDRSRLYTIAVGCDLPATDTDGRRDATVTVDYDPAQRRTITIQGLWTAIATKDATEQYAAQIDAYCTSALNALLPSVPSSKRELVGQRTVADDQDKTLTFTRVFREEIVAQPSGSFDNASIVDPTLSFARTIEHPGDSGGGNVKRLETITVRFDCFLDKTVSVDLTALYDDTIRPYLISQFQTRYSPDWWAIVREGPVPSPYSNQLSVEIMFSAAIDATDVIESVVTSRIVEPPSVVLTGEWNGELFAKHVDQGIGKRLRFSIRAVRVLGSVGPKSRMGGENYSDHSFAEFSSWAGNLNAPGFASFDEDWSANIGGGGGGKWVFIENDSSATTKTLGEPGEEQFHVTDIAEQVVEEWVVKPGDA